MPTIQYKEGADFPELPTKTPLLTKIIESEFVTEDNPWYGKENAQGKIDENETRDVVKVVFECVEEHYSGSRIWFNATASINEKAKLRPLLEAAAFDHDPDKDELQAYDTDDLVGQYVYVSGSFNPKDKDRKFLRPESFMRYAAQFRPGFKKPGKSDPKPEVADAEPEAEDEVTALKRKLAEAEAKSKASETKAEAKPARKASTREKATAKTAEKSTPTNTEPADDDDPPF